MSGNADWLAVLKRHVEEAGAEIDLGALEAGDLLRVVTEHTTYDFVIRQGCEAELKASRADRPAGVVRIMGCTFGRSSTIKPDHLFCGGNLEFTFQGGAMRQSTTAIRKIDWLRRRLVSVE